jgi:O-antigen ligase
MTLFKTISPGSPRFQEIEFSLLLGWALLYPEKIGYSYYLGFICLLVVFALIKVPALKNVALSRFSLILVALNSIFIFSAFFSPHPLRSILFTADLFLISLWFMLFYLERMDMERYLRLMAYVISLSSLAVAVSFILQGGRGPVTTCFKNPILQGIASALAAIVFLHAVLQRYQHADLFLLVLNVAAVILVASKAAFLGLAFFAAAMIFKRRRKWLFLLSCFLLLLVVFPNPMRRMVVHSLRHDPYVFDRLRIWNMSAQMYRHYPWTGVGPDLFFETAPRFNFPQEKGPTRYGKVPESPHSDYWKVIVETGLPGLILVSLFLFFAIRRLLSPPWFELPKLLLAFLLIQMLLFNFVFNFFFILVFFLLLYDFSPSRQRFVALHPVSRVFISSFLIFSTVVLYVFPYIADRCLDLASKGKNVAHSFSLLNRAALFSPLDDRVSLAKTETLRSFAASRFNLEAWADALENARLAQRLNKNGKDAFIQESELFHDVRVRDRYYPTQAEEILAPLRRSRELAPFDPFLLLRQAFVLREFDRVVESRERAQAALELEPDFAAAIVFIHELDGLPAEDPTLRERLGRIRDKAERLNPRPGSYLYNLYRLPTGASGK